MAERKIEMKKIILILFSIILFSCQKKEKLKFYYPTKNIFLKLKNTSELNLQNFANFDKLVDTLEYYKYKGKTTTFKLENKISEYNFKVSTFFGNCSPPLIKFKNIIGISNDTIFKNRSYSIDSLYYLLKKDLLNNRKDPRFSDSPKKLIISLSVSEKETTFELKKLLTKVFQSYNKIKEETKDSIELNLQFNRRVKILPPPPKLSEINEIED